MQLSISVFLDKTDHVTPVLIDMLKSMIVKTNADYLTARSRVLIENPAQYVSEHYKSFYLN